MPNKAQLSPAVIEAAQEAAQKLKRVTSFEWLKRYSFPALLMFQTKLQDRSLAAPVQRSSVCGKSFVSAALVKIPSEIGVVVATAT